MTTFLHSLETRDYWTIRLRNVTCCVAQCKSFLYSLKFFKCCLNFPQRIKRKPRTEVFQIMSLLFLQPPDEDQQIMAQEPTNF